MAFTRKFLKALGIEDDKIEQIMDTHLDVTDALKKERDDAQEKADTADDLQKQLKDAQKKLKEYEGEDSWQKKYEDEKTAKEKAEKDFAEYKADVEAKKTLTSKQTAYKALLKEAGISDKRFDSIVRVTDFGKIELDENGKVKDSENVIKGIKTEWHDFIQSTGERGADTSTPPANNGGTGSSGLSRAAQLAAQHHANLYGATQK